MSGNNFTQQLRLMLIDKLVIGGFLVFAAFGFNRILEAFKSTQSRELESFKLAQSRELEAVKNKLMTEGEASRNLRLAVADVVKKVAAGSHSISWLSWIAKYSPQELTLEHFSAYEKEIHLLLSELVGSRVVLVALDNKTHTELVSLIDRLYNLDVDVGDAKTIFIKDPSEGTKELAKLHSESGKLEDDLLGAAKSLTAFKSNIELMLQA